MKILFTLHQFFPNHYTGTERLVLNLAKQMQKNGHSVKVLTYGINETTDFLIKDGFFIKEYYFEGIPVISIRHLDIPPEVSFSILDPTMERILHTIIAKDFFDIIHVCHPMRTGTIIKVAIERCIPVILTLTDFWLMCPRGIASTTRGQLCQGSSDGGNCIAECFEGHGSEKIEQRFILAKEVLNTVNCIVFPTVFLKTMFMRQMFSGYSQIIRFGIDYSSIQYNHKKYSNNSEITIGFLSSLLPHKGPHILIQAFLSANQNNLHLKIFGDPNSDIEFFEKLQNISKNKKIEFLGRYYESDMGSIISDLDLVALPSMWWENTPLVMLNALAHHVPVIVSDFPGMTEIVEDGINGFAFKPGDVEDLKKVLIKIAHNPILINEIKKNTYYSKRIEEEAFEYECLYNTEIQKKVH
jgi:glycosyltransferase involved in cell wall biosynthesis